MVCPITMEPTLYDGKLFHNASDVSEWRYMSERAAVLLLVNIQKKKRWWNPQSCQVNLNFHWGISMIKSPINVQISNISHHSPIPIFDPENWCCFQWIPLSSWNLQKKKTKGIQGNSLKTAPNMDQILGFDWNSFHEFHQFSCQKWLSPATGAGFAMPLASLGELQGCEAEVLTVTRDTTEADLKQRRELSRLGRVDLQGGAPQLC